jgi:hypothetical protein
MNKNDALHLFQKILHDYNMIESPKYRHAEYEDMVAKNEILQNIKEHLQENKLYQDLVNGISQTLSKIKKGKALTELSRDEIWSNYSERGMNKSIRPYPKKKHNKDTFPIEWMSQGKYKCFLSNGYWGWKNFIVLEELGYALLMSIGGDRLPENSEPIFDTLKSIEERELQLNGNPSTTASIMNRTTYSIAIDDNYFRKSTGFQMSSNEISNLLLETSRVEFKLPYPVVVKDSNGKEKIHNMTYFSRFFELGVEEIKNRKDGVVQLRKYRINFSTILGELFVNNLLSKHNDRVDIRFYNLPENAQFFYRRFLLHIDFKTKILNLETIVEGLGFQDTNKTNLIKTIEKNILTPLQKDNLISAYEISPGLKGTKFTIKRDDTCRRM